MAGVENHVLVAVVEPEERDEHGPVHSEEVPEIPDKLLEQAVEFTPTAIVGPRSRESFSTFALLYGHMSSTIEIPNAEEPCAYCGSAIFDHDPVCVRDCTDDCGSPTYFCNYACLSSYVDDEELTVGDACEWSPE